MKWTSRDWFGCQFTGFDCSSNKSCKEGGNSHYDNVSCCESCDRNISKHVTLSSYICTSSSGGTRNFFCGGGGIEGAKCISEGGKNPKNCQNWLILTIYFLLTGGKWGGGQSLQQGGSNSPCPPWCCHCLQQGCHLESTCTLNKDSGMLFTQNLTPQQEFAHMCLQIWQLWNWCPFSWKWLLLTPQKHPIQTKHPLFLCFIGHSCLMLFIWIHLSLECAQRSSVLSFQLFANFWRFYYHKKAHIFL